MKAAAAELYPRRGVGRNEHRSQRAGAFHRIIVTGGDATVFCWEHDKGITWPTTEGMHD
jgi:hypothetical protein